MRHSDARLSGVARSSSDNRRHWKIAVLVVIALTAASATFAPIASAGNPPLGLYACYLDHDVAYYTLSFKLKSHGRYAVVDGGKGRYAFRKHGKVIRWKSGPFKKYYAIHRHYYAGPLIDIFGKTSEGSFRLVCEHKKS